MTCAALAALATLLASPFSLFAQDRYSIPADPNLKYSTPIALGVAVPDKIETSIGQLNLNDGYPDDATRQKVYDNQTRSMVQTDQQFPEREQPGQRLQDERRFLRGRLLRPESPRRLREQLGPDHSRRRLVHDRLYGPLEQWFDKTRRPGEITPVN